MTKLSLHEKEREDFDFTAFIHPWVAGLYAHCSRCTNGYITLHTPHDPDANWYAKMNQYIRDHKWALINGHIYCNHCVPIIHLCIITS